MSDLIDRQKALEEIYQLPIIDRDAYEFYRDVRKSIKSMPSAEPRKGRWVPVTNGRGGNECSICHSYAPSYKNGDEHTSAYCPNCGAKMEVME